MGRLINNSEFTSGQLAKLRHLEMLTRQRDIRAHRERGRLFVGSAPTSECADERKKLFKEWDKVIEFYGAKSPQNLLRHLRDLYERPETPKDGRQMRFVAAVEELREEEAKLWDELKDKGGKRSGDWISASRKRRRR